jgi:hypothetical protein
MAGLVITMNKCAMGSFSAAKSTPLGRHRSLKTNGQTDPFNVFLFLHHIVSSMLIVTWCTNGPRLPPWANFLTRDLIGAALILVLAMTFQMNADVLHTVNGRYSVHSPVSRPLFDQRERGYCLNCLASIESGSGRQIIGHQRFWPVSCPLSNEAHTCVPRPRDADCDRC